MLGSVFISTTGNGLARASRSSLGKFEVETLLAGVEVGCLAVDPLDRERVYAGTQGQGILRSDDQGKSWRPMGLEGQTVKALAVSPLQRQVVYAGTKPACFFVSTDGGNRWDELRTFRHIPWRWLWFSPAEEPFVAYVQAIALSPTDTQRIVVGIEFGATLLSTDGGQTWSGHRRGALRDCHSLVFHPTDGKWVYEAGGTGGGATCSRDGGRTWEKAGQGLDRHYGWAVAADAGDPSIWYVSASPSPRQAHRDGRANAGIYRRDGAGWISLTGGLPQPLVHMPYALIADPTAAGTLYTGLSNGEVWHSCDYGESWQQLPMRLAAIRHTLVIL
jgi:hypothetical protein